MKRLLSANSKDQSVVLGMGYVSTITGAKLINEDAVGICDNGSSTRICIADGHWGELAAQRIGSGWIDDQSFPVNRITAIIRTRQLETTIYDLFAKPVMDTEQDKTPEAAFVAMSINNNILSFVSYGDCRIMVIRDGRIVVRNKPVATWLGAFSRLGMRNRLPIDEALEYQKVELLSGDTVLVFSDGVDQCVYETQTLSDSFFVDAVSLANANNIHDYIMAEVLRRGAEDNASLAVLTFSLNKS